MIEMLERLRAGHRRARRYARRTAALGFRSIVVPLVECPETDYAVDLACRLGADRGARLVLVAPLVVEQELPLDAHFPAELPHLKELLDRAEAIADSYGVGVRRKVVRTRERGLGQAVAEVAADCRAQLVVVGSEIESRRGFHQAFPQDVLAVLRDAPCPVLVATGPAAGRPAA
jgi:nucleotide-binding universal stress UspA family protein